MSSIHTDSPRGANAIRATELRTISFSALARDNTAAIAEVFEAGFQDGFFYLDLRDAETQPLLDSIEELYQLSETLFDSDQKELMKYDLDIIGPSKIDGYKPAGRNTGVASGKQDGFEIYLIPTNGLLSLDALYPLQCPGALHNKLSLITYVAEKAHHIGNVILAKLSSMLQPQLPIALQEHHRYGQPSTSALGLLKYPPTSRTEDHRLGQIAHTDVGSITVLFNRLGGLQVLEESGEWAFVEPKIGHAVINIGDSLRFLSGKALRSSLHRVVPHPTTEFRPRYSIAYFMRPEFDAEFEDEEGAHWTGIGWHTRKFAVFRATAEDQKKDSVLTGRKGYLGLWENVQDTEEKS
ncbi:putative 2OG-Fe(II) oxygenase family oxidoreductase [Mytilinidion resinicola]|uniref:2OG-Fe(II) oxygenase family oxidoreductase n=1 Tax=Mytilinidion resinicola TaxID=574789 RepID=A0A6A6YFA3_9PEZI|nr:putative 2OG-Fe(II) oxygenase family oxidoreductase [Mytilinidion resinicola]KAF2807213.1 putative 2OG-Fe(II) oxygenase family oxidoreductase [Mytilinidion resinicola]